MDFLRFVFYLGVIYITVDILWNLFLFGLRIVLGINYRDRALYYVLKGVSLYILVSLTAITTNKYVSGSQSELAYLGYPLIGFFVLYFYITSSMQKSRLRAQIKMDTSAMRRMRYNGIFLFAALAFYMLSLYRPEINQTQLTDWLFATIDDIYDLWLFRIILGFLAIIFLVNMLIRGFLMTRLLIFSIFGIPQNPRSNFAKRLLEEQKRSQAQESEVEDAEYEIIEEEKSNDSKS